MALGHRLDLRTRDEPMLHHAPPSRAMATYSPAARRARAFPASTACAPQSRARPGPPRPHRDAGPPASACSPPARTRHRAQGCRGRRGSPALWRRSHGLSCCLPRPASPGAGPRPHTRTVSANHQQLGHPPRDRPPRLGPPPAGLPPGEWPPLCQAASARADREAVSDIGGAGVVVTSCRRLSHCGASQLLQS